MPGTRCSASATDLSGKEPISSAVIRIDHRVGVPLPVLRRFHVVANTGDDDRLGIIRFGSILRQRRRTYGAGHCGDANPLQQATPSRSRDCPFDHVPVSPFSRPPLAPYEL
ncbi:hypothetical protein [Sphingomonas sp. J315]|uniref:hypothetical protein n=1 Tax=Sphingomonas sp. J315 TaxID=2898433 RepID=UPI0021ADCFE6|nr:hypothetical protein [Sphingomonas sp. J315]UUY00499.1 hypothetical protein LRS08_05215 [Sphingomonas sp. J315]